MVREMFKIVGAGGVGGRDRRVRRIGPNSQANALRNRIGGTRVGGLIRRLRSGINNAARRFVGAR